MLVLNANQEQKQMFYDLIQEIDAQVVWNGRFILMGDRLILEGVVRSLFFHFDIQQAEVKWMDLSFEDEEELQIEDYPGLEDLIAMAVFVFQKWGVLTGITVEQNVPQLEQLFGKILAPYQLDTVFTDENIEFYQSGMRITYEDVAETVIAYEETTKDQPQSAERKRMIDLSAIKRVSSQNVANKRKESEKKADGLADSRDSETAAKRIEKYHARISVLDRLSDLQKKALIRDIRLDKLLSDKEKEELYFPVQDYECQMRIQQIDDELKDKANGTYAHIQKMIKKAEKEELFEKTKQAVLERLHDLSVQYGVQEVREIMKQTPQHVERAEYQELMEKLAPYEEIHLAEYQESLRKMRETLEIKEISNMLMQSPKKSRKDYVELLRRIEEQNFARENAAPYFEQILDRMEEYDKERLNKLLSKAGVMDFETAASIYEMISQESFLPKLRTGALAVISKRLEEISLSECRIYVNILRKSMDGVIQENPKHHFYPAEKLLQKTIIPEEKRLFDNAVAAYAEKKGLFEYPIFLADTSKEGSGRDGILLTSEHLFYSTRLSGYRISLPLIRSVRVSLGLLNRKSLVVEEADGTRHKIPYVVENEILQEWADILGQLIRQLQERPVCEKLTYDALEAQNKNSCSRCGCVYEDGNVCPECGLKAD